MASTSLSAHIAKLKARPESIVETSAKREALLFWGTFMDKEYLPHLKGAVGSYTTFVRLEKIDTVTQLTMYCDQKQITKVLSTSVHLLKKLLHWDKRKEPSLDNYAGSYFTIPAFKKDSPRIEVVFISPLKQLVTMPRGKFMAKRLISKLIKPESWYVPTPFTFEVLKEESVESNLSAFQSCFLIAVDIETLREDAQIRCIGYTGFWYDPAVPTGIKSHSVVIPLTSVFLLGAMRAFNNLPAPKVLQNGNYDNSYLCRYNAPLYNYLYDTANLFHCWYSELPKDLGFLNSFFVREATYWKDLSETNDLYEYYKYNALDTWGTGNAFLAMLTEAPKYAITNYLLEFPLVFPCHLSEMTGIERDMSSLALAKLEQDKIILDASRSLDKILNIPEGQAFNVNSPIQMKALLKILGCKDLTSADEKNLKKARFRHPFNARIINLILIVRKARKLVSTYITAGKEFHRQDGTGNRILFSLKPHGTETSRLASREHHFWCGLQVQNIPRGPAVKRTLKADPGFYICEVDLEQAESRDTAYISGDANLIQNVEYSPDFHSANAAAFFGVAFEKIFDVLKKEVLDKPLRQLAKPVNHGANYNMGAYVLIETMGEENIIMAKQLLNLPRFWGHVQVAEHLLAAFHKTYPGIRGTFYAGVSKEIMTTGMLVSTALHYHTDIDTYEEEYERLGAWSRRCFSNPEKSKTALNSYIAHPPQSLNAQTLNKGYLDVFHNVAINPEYSNDFKLIAQIHDSILFQYRIGHTHLIDKVVTALQIPVTVRAYDGKIRTFTVPASAKNGKPGKPPKYWSETE